MESLISRLESENDDEQWRNLHVHTLTTPPEPLREAVVNFDDAIKWRLRAARKQGLAAAEFVSTAPVAIVDVHNLCIKFDIYPTVDLFPRLLFCSE